MKSTQSKIRARATLMNSGKKAKAISIISVMLQTFFIGALAFSLFMLSQMKNSQYGNASFYKEILFYTLFAFSAAISYCFVYLVRFNTKRWYYKNATEKVPVTNFFSPESIGKQVKIIYLFTLKNVLSVCWIIFYLLPCVAVAFIALSALTDGGINRTIFILTVVLFLSFLVSGLVCWFVHIQRYAFFNEIIVRHPTLSVTEIINKSKQITSGRCFSLAKFKVSFVFWFMICVLVIPLIFVVPYYKQSFAFFALKLLGVKHAKEEATKPVVLMHLAVATD